MMIMSVSALNATINSLVLLPQTKDDMSPYRLICCPNIDADDPPMSKRFKALMTRRPSVERMIKQLKCDLSDDRLSKRGNDSFQAHLDKTMIAFHILLRNHR